eukprot:COSAG02_NODE_5666_length_4143_cov_6.233680_1_plen_71_part_10
MRAVESMPYCTVDAPATRRGARACAAALARRGARCRRAAPTKPERPPSSGHTDASAESWCAALHQGVACAQ